MRIPLTAHGWKEMSLGTLVLGVLMALCAWLFWPLAVVPLIIWVWLISFFRDPTRHVPSEPNILVAPADGKITHVTELANDEAIGGPALRISVFLSVFNVHINRSPCKARIRSITYRKGEFINAMSPDSQHRNEANTLVLDGQDGAPRTLVLSQIAGLIARRIVCPVKPGDALEKGQRFGMIKFGSRTDLTIPRECVDQVAVQVGQTVHAGETIMVRLRPSSGKD